MEYHDNREARFLWTITIIWITLIEHGDARHSAETPPRLDQRLGHPVLVQVGLGELRRIFLLQRAERSILVESASASASSVRASISA